MANRTCKHTSLYLDVSPHASKAGFKRPNRRQRISAATQEGRALKELELLTSKELLEDEMAFPGPLVLPGDDLAEDPEYPPQDFNQWRDEEERNPVTKERKTIYIVPSPFIEKSVSKMQTWSVCTTAKEQDAQVASPPDITDIVEYLSAFFYGMDVKIFDQPFHWQKWESYDGTVLKNSNTEKRIGLKSPSKELFGIRCRASPDGVSPMQVNLNDVLDALAENIPSDAHSIMILLDQDMYEGDGDGDIFCAGRAYGGSRIAAVSTFRDQPSCTPKDNGHAWPSSHCAAYINQLCHLQTYTTKPQPVQRKPNSGPLQAAIKATTTSARHESSGIPSEAPTAQWLGRIAVTMAHELCHCLGLDHCVYFACAMQGCGSVEEAQRQPPYVCPVCLEKLAAAIGEGVVPGWNDEVWSMAVREKYVRDRYEALRKVCERWSNPSISRMFAGYRAWLDVVIERSL
ncbi:hypothetical protein TGAMA5MH_02753 [Trichoderma gamsii]|uniref:Archaemetzincin-2 n=1 Tax=Trichoderma gamsii TaxID=398673 RepID=A0A2K0TJ32_9HYPO|nr:hypothetical protein TGAMA5MH_02753 [Trichoderma gamsii]